MSEISAPAPTPGDGEKDPVDEAALRLFHAGQDRARERMQRVLAMRTEQPIVHVQSLILAVLERWNIDPPEATIEEWANARVAVHAVLNCLAIAPDNSDQTDGTVVCDGCGRVVTVLVDGRVCRHDNRNNSGLCRGSLMPVQGSGVEG